MSEYGNVPSEPFDEWVAGENNAVPFPLICLRWAVRTINSSEATLVAKSLAVQTINTATYSQVNLGNRCVSWAECDVRDCFAGSLLKYNSAVFDAVEASPFRLKTDVEEFGVESVEITLDDCRKST